MIDRGVGQRKRTFGDKHTTAPPGATVTADGQADRERPRRPKIRNGHRQILASSARATNPARPARSQIAADVAVADVGIGGEGIQPTALTLATVATTAPDAAH